MSKRMSPAVELPTLRILALGMEGYGKTCALATTHWVMSHEGVEDFTLMAEERSQRVKLNSYYRGMAESGEFPDKSVNGEIFSLICSLSYDPIFKVSWYDYPGGWTREESEEHEQLEQHMALADCVICCVAADKLVDAFKKGIVIECMAHYNTLFQEYGVKNRQASGVGIRHIPVVFMLTKFDLCRGRDRTLVKDAIQNCIQKSPLCSTYAKWLVVVIPVTLGEELQCLRGAEAKQTFDPLTFEPWGVHLPLLFAVCSRFSDEYLRETRKKHERIQGQIDGLGKALDELESKWVVWKRSQKIANNKAIKIGLAREIEELERVASKYGRYFEALRQCVRDGIDLAYYQGQRVEDLNTIFVGA